MFLLHFTPKHADLQQQQQAAANSSSSKGEVTSF